MKKYDPYDVALGEIIARRRSELNVSQERVGERFGVTKGTICNYEKGRRSMNASMFFEMCDFLFLEPNKVAAEVEKMVKNAKV